MLLVINPIGARSPNGSTGQVDHRRMKRVSFACFVSEWVVICYFIRNSAVLVYFSNKQAITFRLKLMMPVSALLNLLLNPILPMRTFPILLFTFITFAGAVAQSDLKLWYKQPARNWNEALPVGNGRIGAMVFGKVNEELIQLNEETLWSGGPVNSNPNPGVASYLPAIRKALMNEEFEEAEKADFKSTGFYLPNRTKPLGDLIIRHNFTSTPTAYYRDLNISKRHCYYTLYRGWCGIHTRVFHLCA